MRESVLGLERERKPGSGRERRHERSPISRRQRDDPRRAVARGDRRERILCSAGGLPTIHQVGFGVAVTTPCLLGS